MKAKLEQSLEKYEHLKEDGVYRLTQDDIYNIILEVRPYNIGVIGGGDSHSVTLAHLIAMEQINPVHLVVGDHDNVSSGSILSYNHILPLLTERVNIEQEEILDFLNERQDVNPLSRKYNKRKFK